MNLKRFKPLIMAFILTLNSLSFSIRSSPQILDYAAIYYGFPLFWLTRVLVTFAGQVDHFYFGYLPFIYPKLFGYLAFLVDLIFWLVVAHFALRFLRLKKVPLTRNKLILGILGIIIFALESFWIAFAKLHSGAFFWEALLGGILMFAGFFCILSIGRLEEAKEKRFS